MTKKQTKAKSKAAKSTITRALVLFGVGEDGTPRAARFVDENQDLIERAAQAMGLRLGVATEAKHFKVVSELPVGRIHATGKTAVPDIPHDLYRKLVALVGGEAGPISTSFAQNWEELGPNHLVVAQESVEHGWWSAVIVKRDGDNFTLKWRDHLSLPEFERPITAIALLSSEPR
jgi:hypothetical protein